MAKSQQVQVTDEDQTFFLFLSESNNNSEIDAIAAGTDDGYSLGLITLCRRHMWERTLAVQQSALATHKTLMKQFYIGMRNQRHGELLRGEDKSDIYNNLLQIYEDHIGVNTNMIIDIEWSKKILKSLNASLNGTIKLIKK